MIYKIECNIYEGGNTAKKKLIETSINLKSLILYKFNFMQNSSFKGMNIRRRKISDIDNFDFDLVKESIISIHDYSIFKDIEDFESFIKLCKLKGKRVLLPFTYYCSDSGSVYQEIYKNSVILRTTEILDKSIIRDIKMARLLENID